MLAFGIGAGVGACAGTGHLYGMRGKSGLLRGIVVGLIVAILLEYAVRGRRAIIAGNAYMGLCFVLRVVFKFLGKVFDCGGGTVLASVAIIVALGLLIKSHCANKKTE